MEQQDKNARQKRWKATKIHLEAAISSYMAPFHMQALQQAIFNNLCEDFERRNL